MVGPKGRPKTSVRYYYSLLNPEERSLKVGPTGRPETSVRYYYYSLLNNPEERSLKMRPTGRPETSVRYYYYSLRHNPVELLQSLLGQICVSGVLLSVLKCWYWTIWAETCRTHSKGVCVFHPQCTAGDRETLSVCLSVMTFQLKTLCLVPCPALPCPSNVLPRGSGIKDCSLQRVPWNTRCQHSETSFTCP
jgi:hypothetical protein